MPRQSLKTSERPYLVRASGLGTQRLSLGEAMTRESVFGRVGSIFVLVLCGLWTACGGSSTPGTAIVAIAKTQNPLVAQYSLSTNCAGQAMVEFGPNTSYGRSTALYGMVAGSTTNILVAGMRAS